MGLTESAVDAQDRDQFMYYLPNKQYEWELNKLMTFLSLWAGCIDSWLC